MRNTFNALVGLLLAIMTNGVLAQSCYNSSIMSPTPFMGNDSEIFKLADGSIWEVKYEYEYMYEYYPDVVICPSRGKLLIKGKSLNIAQVSAARPSNGSSQGARGASTDLIETRIDGEFEGWEGETIFKLVNGQIWQQSIYAYTYSYAYSPKVMIFKRGGQYEMQVEGVSGKIAVTRLK